MRSNEEILQEECRDVYKVTSGGREKEGYTDLHYVEYNSDRFLP